MKFWHQSRVIKAAFSEETMSPKLQIEWASMLTALYYVTMIQAEIHHFFQGRAWTNTILVKL